MVHTHYHFSTTLYQNYNFLAFFLRIYAAYFVLDLAKTHENRCLQDGNIVSLVVKLCAITNAVVSHTAENYILLCILYTKI